METDRELLEAAARAAGMQYPKWNEAHGYMMIGLGAETREWSPLTDDGDALRLAVKLKIEPHFMEGGGTDAVRCDENGNESVLAAEIDSDPYAATRRAIVRAAASLQETKNG